MEYKQVEYKQTTPNAKYDKILKQVRNMELLAYFTCCNLQPAHLLLALRMAMASAFKGKNYITAASFAQRLLELPDLSSERHADLRTKVCAEPFFPFFV